MKRLCQVLRVSRSGYYAWLGRPISARALQDADLTKVIVEIHRDSRRTYGSPRIHAELLRRGEHCSRKRVARLMSQAGLVGVHSRRHRHPRRATLGEGVDLVNRDFSPAGPDQVWAADVTQFRTGEGWLHVAAVLDLWSRRVVGWSMGTTPNAALVSDALIMAFQRRRPDRRVVHHSDHGAAYTSLAFSQRIAELELDQSLGTTGDCYDNAAVEAFWSTLKRELAWIHGTTAWINRDALRAALFDYIETFYNVQRTQSRLGYQSPINYEKMAVT